MSTVSATFRHIRRPGTSETFCGRPRTDQDTLPTDKREDYCDSDGTWRICCNACESVLVRDGAGYRQTGSPSLQPSDIESLEQLLGDICHQAHKHEVQHWKDAPGTDAEKLRAVLDLAREALEIIRGPYHTSWIRNRGGDATVSM